MKPGYPVRLLSLATTTLLVAATGLTLSAGQAPAAGAGAAVFTAAQADSGLKLYQTRCASCHSGDLGGNGEAPALAGSSFMSSWRTQSTQDLFKYAQGMPPGGPHLADDEYVAVVAYILRQNGAKAGDQPFTPATVAPIGTIATGEAPAGPASGAPPPQ